MSLLVVVAMVSGFLMVQSPRIVSAQDDLRVNADSVHLKFENDRVRVLESILQPGQKEKMHSHPSFLVYVIKGGKIRIHLADGKTTETELKGGDVIFRDPVTHWGENIGTTEIDEILVELKSLTPPNETMKPTAPDQMNLSETDLMQLPHDLPVPADDGACDHLPGSTLPSVSLVATTGGSVDLSKVPGCVVVFAYPRTGRPNEPPLVPNWDLIPGARGCTPQTCGFRDLHSKFKALHCRVYGLSTQSPEYQQEMVARLNVPFPVLSDEKLEFIRGLRLPTFTVAGQVLVKRLVLVLEDGRVKKVFYPVFPPDKSALTVLQWLSAAGQRHSP